MPESFDGKLVVAISSRALFDLEESNRVFDEQGVAAFTKSEADAAREPLSGGLFKNFLPALHRIPSEYPPEHSPIRTALVTERGAPAHERVIRTLRAWNLRIDEALFPGGLDRGRFLKAFGADIFFDGQRGHCESASTHAATGHVPIGVANQE